MNQITARALCLGYGKREVLGDIDLTVRKGEFISIIGPSGVGKSTLLLAFNASIKIFDGDLEVLGHPVRDLAGSSLKKMRARIGVIFQGYNLVKRLTVFDNIASGMLKRMLILASLAKYYSHDQYERIYECMKIVGIEDAALQRCDCLSGGQMQRVAIARALAQQPDIILADEPISSLDPASAVRVMDTLKEINRHYGITIIANLHQLEHARNYCSRIIGINHGQIVFDGEPARLNDSLIRDIYYGSKKDDRPDERKHMGILPVFPEVVNA